MTYCLVAFKNFTQDLVCYRINHTISSAHIGYRIKVPFGKKTCTGVLVALSTTSQVSEDKVKTVIELLDDEPLISPTTIELLKRISRYYYLSLNQMICLALHTDLFDPKLCLSKIWLRANSASPPTSKSQLSVFETCLTPTCIWALKQQFQIQLIEKMQENELLQHDQPQQLEIQPSLVTLSQAQQSVVDQIDKQWQGTHLIWGVTGSGKTEIYTHLIVKALAQQQQVLVLVPEIALTSQTADKISKRTNTEITVIHSNLSKKQKLCRWMQARSGSAKIILGTRSALLCELPKLGLIIVDEEHDSSYRHHSPLFFSAKDMAILKAHLQNIPIILGSATPSLESLHNAYQKRYELHALLTRIHTKMPKVNLVKHQGPELLDTNVANAIEQTLANGKNVLVFIGRRGWSNIIYCIKCEWQARCNQCSGPLVFHQDKHLHCHKCMTKQTSILDCPSCKQSELIQHGYGSQQVAHELAKIWPNYQVLRFDTDQKDSDLKQQFEALHQHKKTIIVGTQMITKGHDLASVQTVVVIQADQGLYAHDFRAEENVFAELVQTSGRCGRRSDPGQVWIQTKNPDHPLFQALLQTRTNYQDALLEKRKTYHLPPFSYLATLYILIKPSEYDELLNYTNTIDDQNIQGPLPSPKGNREQKVCYSWSIMSPSRQARLQSLHMLQSKLSTQQKWKIWWQIDSHFCP